MKAYYLGHGVLYHGDALDVLPALPTGEFKLIFADYPFAIKGGRKKYMVFLRDTTREFYRLLADDGWLVVINNPTNLFRTAPYLQEFEFRNEVALLRKHAFCPPGMFCFKHNAMWVLSKKKQKLTLPEKMPDVIEYCNGYRGNGMRHPEAIPLWLAELIVKATTKVGDRILDPFAGSGTVLLAAEEHGCEWVGVEIKDKYINLILSRVGGRVAQSGTAGAL